MLSIRTTDRLPYIRIPTYLAKESTTAAGYF